MGDVFLLTDPCGAYTAGMGQPWGSASARCGCLGPTVHRHRIIMDCVHCMENGGVDELKSPKDSQLFSHGFHSVIRDHISFPRPYLFGAVDPGRAQRPPGCSQPPQPLQHPAGLNSTASAWRRAMLRGCWIPPGAEVRCAPGHHCFQQGAGSRGNQTNTVWIFGKNRLDLWMR